MAPKTSANLVDGAERILEDGTANTIFSATDIAAQLQDSLKELSEYSPWEIMQTKLMESSHRLGEQLTGNKGREIDISDIENLIDLKVEYPVGNFPPTFRDFKRYGGKLYLDITSRPTPGQQNDSAGDAQELTGTVTLTSGSNAVTGSGTAFTSELEVGYYISTASGTNWYRVAKITDDTNLVISINCATADTGADTADSTRYWYEYVNLWCKKNHYVEATMTDFYGAIDSGSASGYAQDVYRIHVDALVGVTTVPKDMLFSITGTLGIYRTTEASTLSGGEGDLIIEPRLKERAAENTRVTFLGSSLNQNEERLLMELVAARSAFNWVGDARTAIDTAISGYGSASSVCGNMSAVVGQIVTDVGLMKSVIPASLATAKTAISNASNKVGSAAAAAALIDSAIGDYTSASPGDTAHVSLGNAFDQLDFAITQIGVIKTAIATEDTLIDDALDAVSDQIGVAVIDLTTDFDGVINTITTGKNVEQLYISKAMAQLSIARAKLDEARALQTPDKHYGDLAAQEVQLAMAQIREAQGYIALESTIVGENAVAVRSHITSAQGYIRVADAYIRADAQNVASWGRAISAELSGVTGYARLASNYLQQANTAIRASYSITAVNRWAQLKLRDTLMELRRMRKPRQKSYSYPRE